MKKKEKISEKKIEHSNSTLKQFVTPNFIMLINMLECTMYVQRVPYRRAVCIPYC